jgi:UTP--glucose-1-phosphate uridylyltransferase
MSDHFDAFGRRMRAEKLPDVFITVFADYYQQLVEGQTGLIPESEIRPVESLPDAETLPARLSNVGQAALAKTAVIKLNGGLGTSMGLEQAKSLLVVKEGLTFLDIIARQALSAGVPLVLMNSFATDADSWALLDERYPELQKRDVPLSFLQHKEPKVTQSDLSPAVWPQNPELEWCPPGHGDIYVALVTSGTLDALLDAGYEYAFVANVDNLGAVIDTAILGYFAENKFSFMMEVADRTEMDRKGGHVAGSASDGHFLLRESAQCPEGDMAAFQDISRHKYFNTNNLWLNLPALKRLLEERNYRLGLPMIRNAKTVDPRDNNSTAVYQLETAMGSAIAVFPGAQALRVPRRRFAPVKTTNDLLAVRSDAYTMTDDFRVVQNPARLTDQVLVTLDPVYFKFITDLNARFPHGAPSLVGCDRLSVQGDFKFGRDVVCTGTVWLINASDDQVEITDKTWLQGEQRW